jgi:hypothetical protein
MPAVRIARNATAVRADDGRESKPLADWRQLDAFVLLGDPGAGKSWAFDDECRAVDGVLLSARNVVSGITPMDVDGRTVFIDGLDEVRAGSTDGRVPFDAIRRWLHDHGRPRFRLSCREADWLGSNDKSNLEHVAPGGRVEVLHLDPLSQDDIETILADRAQEVPDVEQFLHDAERAGISELLRNPLLLDLLVKATAGGAWPDTRAALYESACRQLAREFNKDHLAVNPMAAGGIERLLHDAGLLFAVLLLSGKHGIALQDAASPDDVALGDVSLQLHDQNAALRSKLFSTQANIAVPRHRSIAEFLAAKALARRIEEGLPLGRVLALMRGFDGRPVEPLRGLWAWLAVHHVPGRPQLIALDPLGFVLNADAAMLSSADRADVLRALRDAAEEDPWFRNQAWVSHPFGPLASADMAATYEALLRDRPRSRGHEAFIDCVFDALRHGQSMPSLTPALEAWVEDGSAGSHLRIAAYAAWKGCVGFLPSKALGWLQAIRSGAMTDGDDRLTGSLLADLYPAHVGPAEVFTHLHVARRSNLIAAYQHFWTTVLWRQTPNSRFAELADAWLNHVPVDAKTDPRDYDISRLRSQLLARVLTNAGDKSSDESLFRWLGIGLDEHGFSQLRGDQSTAVRQWLTERPQRMKAIVALGFAQTQPDKQGHWPFWEAEQRLHGASLPRDWHAWLLEQAAAASTPELAEHCFFPAARAALEPVTGFDSPSQDEIEAWVDAHKARWPEAARWLDEAWSMPLDHWRSKEGKRNRQAESQRVASEAKRKQSLEPHLPSLLDGSAPSGLLHQIAVAHEHGFSDLSGDTPLERVRNLLVSDEAQAQAVIDALPLVLARSDLPTADEVIALEAKSKQYYIQPAALLAARLAFERDPGVAMQWQEDLARRLVAYYLTDGTGDMPGWYRELAQQRPAWVAPVLVAYTLAKFKRKTTRSITGLWALGKEADHVALARLALPQMLSAFPLRADETALGTLNRSLLPALAVLDEVEAAAIVRMKLRQTAMSAAQRIAWLVADLPYRTKAADELAALVGRNERRAVLLGGALYEQGTLDRVMQRLQPQSVRRLIAVLAPITAVERWQRVGIVTVADHRGDTVRALFSALSSNPSADARDALNSLEGLQSLSAWGDMLRYSLRTQHSTAREASYSAASPRQVAATLANEAPANAADLQALVMQHLDDMQAAWRGADTFALKGFWQDERQVSHSENDCRDLLLDRLRERLALQDILVSREKTAAQDKRADACAEFMRDGKRIALPIEVKKANHDKLWTAWRDQLQRYYTNDPDADGHGLYLVLWFGQKVATHPEGLKPQGAAHLQSLIEQRIPEQDRSRLAVRVLDLSWPEVTSGPARAPAREAGRPARSRT